MQAKTNSAPAEVEFKVERVFYFKGEPLEKGKTYTLPRAFAIEMQSANKGHIKVAEVKPVPVPSQDTPSAPSAGDVKVKERAVAEAQAKEKSDARK